MMAFVKSILLLCLLIGSLSAVDAETTGEWVQSEFEGESYFLYKPAQLESVEKIERSLMVNLHGCGQKAAALKDKAGWESPADKAHMLVVIPEVPQGGVIAGCWNYYGEGHTRDNRHNGHVLKLTQKIIKEHNINPHKVFISGISSGAALAFTLSCLAPDVFAGVALNAGPSIATQPTQVGRASLPIAEITKHCREWAGENSRYFSTQVASVIFGDDDFLVDPEYSKRNARALAKLYESEERKTFSLESLEGTHLKGKGLHFLIKDRPVVSLIENTGLGHNWPGGQEKSSGDFVNQKSLYYAKYLIEYFLSVNRRP